MGLRLTFGENRFFPINELEHILLKYANSGNFLKTFSKNINKVTSFLKGKGPNMEPCCKKFYLIFHSFNNNSQISSVTLVTDTYLLILKLSVTYQATILHN